MSQRICIVDESTQGIVLSGALAKEDSMVTTPEYQKSMQQSRNSMSPEERQVAAIEQIADQLYAIHNELMTLRVSYQNASRSQSGFGRSS